jgi:hypothetical protein
MEQQSWPLDPMSAAALVLRVVDDIDDSSEDERDALLSDLLCAAWGNVWAQNQ